MISKESARKIRSSGFVVLKKIENEFKILGLLQKTQYDMPKGHIEKGEAPLDAAFRETEEESGITDLTLLWGLDNIVLNDKLKLYIAVTNQDAVIRPNPESGQYEHEDHQWLTFDEMESKALDYLVPAVIWARNKVNSMEGQS
jgi:8-oxo-dGTP pyrophosphatase MutT (NUDIX family)